MAEECSILELTASIDKKTGARPMRAPSRASRTRIRMRIRARARARARAWGACARRLDARCTRTRTRASGASSALFACT
eukprot:2570536-Pleurochrysis_carterae.AAC.3